MNVREFARPATLLFLLPNSLFADIFVGKAVKVVDGFGLLPALVAFAEYVVEVTGGDAFGELLHQLREAIEMGVLGTERIHIAL